MKTANATELSAYTLAELAQLCESPERAVAKMALRVYRAGTREVLAANTELHCILRQVCTSPALAEAIRADLS